jgi:hypothetical protein
MARRWECEGDNASCWTFNSNRIGRVGLYNTSTAAERWSEKNQLSQFGPAMPPVPPEGVNWTLISRAWYNDTVTSNGTVVPAAPKPPVSRLAASLEEIARVNSSIRSMVYKQFKNDPVHTWKEYRNAIKHVRQEINTMKKKLHNQLITFLRSRGMSVEEAEADFTVFIVHVEKDMFGNGTMWRR